MVTGRFLGLKELNRPVRWFFGSFGGSFRRGVKSVLFSDFCNIAKSEYFGYSSQAQYMKGLVKAARILRDYSDDYLKSLYNGNKPFSSSFN